ncbi:hypothetical protein [Nannocystis punicea]|uniref:Uncharacterized protein n=1 Tax=Nannocystis punicea TaxID=2995304 RepID=A0ABY7H959_9BACT|nr:hypothetical protein [Nannocystis poenicansa]WAS95801.1 hypothetical protein O0S08_06525 [Nannocystis poenicansa]
MSEPLPTTPERRARECAAHVVLLGVVLLGCTSRSISATTNDSVAAPPKAIAPPPRPSEAIEPAPEVRVSIDFDPSAVLLGSCGEFASDYDDHRGPFVVGPGVVPWAEGEPLWIMTNAGGVVEAVAGRRLDRCGDEVPPEEAAVVAKGEREDGEDGDGDPCVPAVAIVTAKPLVCDPILPSGIPAPLSLGDHDRERGFLFALPRHVRSPSVIAMRFEVRVEGLCWQMDPDNGAHRGKIPLTAAPAPMDRHFTRRVPSSKARRWRALTVHYGAPEHPPVHVYYSVDRRLPHRQAQWDVFAGDPEGSPTSWVRTADRRVFDSPFVRERNCGIPYSNPSPVLAFVHDGRLHWITVDESSTIEARIWRFDEEALTPVRAIPGKLYTHYF